MMTDVNPRTLSFKKLTHQIVGVTAATLIVISLASMAVVLSHMLHDARQRAEHTLDVIGTVYGTALRSPLGTYNRFNEPRIWIMQGGRHVVAKSPNAEPVPPTHVRSGFVGPLNAYQLTVRHKTRSIVVDVPLTGDDIVIEVLFAILVIGSAGAALTVRGVAGRVTRHTVQSVRSMTSAAENMLDSGTIMALPVLTHGDEFYDLSVLLNRLLSDLRERQERERVQLADFTHHLRTPLMVIQGNLDVLQRDAFTTPQARAALTTINTTLSEMKSLVSDLLIMEQASNFSPEILKPMRYVDLVHEVVEYARAIASEFSHIFVQTSEDWNEDIYIMVYPKFARRAFWAIVDNAVKYCDPSDGRIGIFPACDLPGFSGVTVANNGPEISPTDLPHIFKRFYRGTHSRDIPGSGLGLSLVRSLTREQNGTVDVTSRNGLTRVTLRFRNM